METRTLVVERGIELDEWLERLSFLHRIALDTSAVIYEVEGVSPYSALTGPVLAMMARGLIVGVISTVVEIEALVRPLQEQNQVHIDRLELFFRQSPNLLIRDVDRAISRTGAEVRARTRLSLPDAVIAATALEERCDAIIGNDALMAARLNDTPYLVLDDYLS